MLSKSMEHGSDALIIDLEDAVPAASKAQALDIVASWLSEQDKNPTAIWVRLNPQPDLLDREIAAVVQPALTGVYLPKVSSPSEVGSVAARLDELEAASGIDPGTLRIAPLLETAAGILSAAPIAAAPRVSHMALGEADLAADLGMQPSPDGRELAPIRTAVVVASAAAKLNPPIGPVYTTFRDLESLRKTSIPLRRMGYGGRAAIHPDQIPIINAAFSPTVEELASARDVVDRFDAAREAGSAVTVAEDGSLIDGAIVRRARHTLLSRNSTTKER
jgi:citrate lyase subunit beta/citryl-CoA lyase